MKRGAIGIVRPNYTRQTSDSLSLNRGLQSSTLKAAVGGHEALLDSNLVFQLLVHSLGISGFELDPHYCQLPVAEEFQPDRNSCPAVLTVIWIVLDYYYTCLLYTSPSPRDLSTSRMPSSA